MKRKILNLSVLVFGAILVLMLTSCGPKRTELNLHVDENVVISKVEIVNSDTKKLFKTYKNLNYAKGETFKISSPQGYYFLYISIDYQKSKDLGYVFPKEYDIINAPLFLLYCDTKNKDYLDEYFSNATPGYKKF